MYNSETLEIEGRGAWLCGVDHLVLLQKEAHRTSVSYNEGCFREMAKVELSDGFGEPFANLQKGFALWEAKARIVCCQR